LHAASAEGAGGFSHWHVKGGRNDGGKAAPGKFNGVDAHYFVANTHALTAHNAVLVVSHKEGVVIIVVGTRNFKVKAGFFDVVAIGVFLQVTIAVFVADYAVQGVVRDKEVNQVAAHCFNFFRFGVNDHTVLRRHTATGFRLGPSFHQHQTHPATAVKMLKTAEKYNLADRLTDITQKTLILAGAEDRFIPASVSEKMYHRIPSAELFIAKAGTHSLPIEQPDLVNLKIEEFFTSVNSD